jgi:TPP-dependent pyruvate/acetoin dehydrogenase alpha subunit
MAPHEQQQLASLPMTSVEASDGHRSVISPETLKQLYKLMLRLRAHERKGSNATKRERTFYFGEACEAAAVIDLRSGDAVATVPAQLLGLLARGESSTNRNDCKSRAGTWSLIDEGGRDRLAMAAGLARAHRIQQASNVVIAFAALGEIARACDSVQFAQRQNLPIIYIEKASTNVRKSKPTPHDLPTIPVDDSDAIAVYRVAYEAIDKARRGAGPTLIQCIGHRNLPAGIRFMDQRGDPIAYIEHYLRKQNLWSEDLRF